MKYLLQKSETPGWWVFTDTENKIVIRFEEGRFNETQEVTLLDDSGASATEIAAMMRERGDYIVRRHSDIVFE